jgi:hypothetical protein
MEMSQKNFKLRTMEAVTLNLQKVSFWLRSKKTGRKLLKTHFSILMSLRKLHYPNYITDFYKIR